MDPWVLSGLIVTLLGIACGIAALARTWTEHASGPMLPDPKVAGQRACALATRLLPRLRKRPVVTGGGRALASVDAIGVGDAVSVRVRPGNNATADELIEHLLRRVDRLENVTDEDRATASAETAAVRADLAFVSERVHEEALRLEALTKSVAVGTVRLQLVGLILIGVGTALMSAPSLT